MTKFFKTFKITLIFIIIALLLSGSTFVFALKCEKIRENTLRLHIIPNSDSDYDQSLKLRIRDRLLSEMGYLFGQCENIDETKKLCRENLLKIKLIAANEIAKENLSYEVEAELCDMFFETRTYDNVTMPAGTYSALRITIGKAEGKNWWCVLFPPLCVSTATDKHTELLEPVTDAYPKYKVKFKIVELFEKLLLVFKG